MGWGTGRWGGAPYGSGASASAVMLLLAEAIANRTVRVTVSEPPLNDDPTVDGDAMNPGSWVITRSDTGATLTVLSVAAFDANVFDLSTLEVLGPFTVTHNVNASRLRDVTGAPISAPSALDFPGILASTDENDDTKQAARGIYATDVANPPFSVSGGDVGGTLIVNAGGDYANVTGAELVKKLILRRLMTRRGSFFHMPEYGLGFEPKTTIVPARIAASERELKDQILLEREVEEASVQISIADQYSVITISARIKSIQQPLRFQVQVPR